MNRAAFAPVILCLLLSPPLFADEEADAPAPPTAEEVLEQMKDRTPAVRLAGTVDAAEVQDKAVTTQLLKLLKDKDYQVRMAAIDSLSVRRGDSDRKKAAQAIAARLPALSAKAVDEEEYLLAISALHDLAQEVSLKALLDIDLDEGRESAKERLMAVGNVPSPKAIEGLIDLMAKGRKRGRNRQRQFAAQALQYATGEKYGNDPDAWRSWWRDVKKTFDLDAAFAAREEEREKAREREEKKRVQAEEKARRREERERKRREREGPGDEEADK